MLLTSLGAVMEIYLEGDEMKSLLDSDHPKFTNQSSRGRINGCFLNMPQHSFSFGAVILGLKEPGHGCACLV